MHRRIRLLTKGILFPPLLAIATVVGSLAAVLWTAPGHALLARLVSQWISGATRGSVEIRGVSGNIIGQIQLDSVTVRDSSGMVVLSTPRLSAHYQLRNFITRNLIFTDVQLDQLTLHLVRLRKNRWNYEEVFHIGEGKGGNGGPPERVELRNLTINGGSVRVDVPTGPHEPKQPITRNARQPAQIPTENTADGLVRVYAAENVQAHLSLLRISTPKRDPLLARITAFHAGLNNPNVAIKALAGEIIAAHDTLIFRIDSAALPSTRVRGGGALRWPRDTVLYDFTLDADRMALEDLRWISPDFPDWRGHAHVVALSETGSRNTFRLSNLVMGDGHSSANGVMTVVADEQRGLGFRGLDLMLASVPVAVLRPFVDTLPVAGTLTGHLLTDGFFDALHLGGDLVFADALVAGSPPSRLRIDGIVQFGGAEGAVFEQFQLDQSTLALGTVRQQIPSVLIPGELHLNGRLDGPWKNITFTGTAEHFAPDGSLSRMVGAARFDTHHLVLGLGLDANFDQLSFDALRTGYPALTARGGLTGHVVANGRIDSLDLAADVTGEIGTIHARGRVNVNSPHYAADSLVLDLERVDVDAILGNGQVTALSGRVIATGIADSGAPMEGRLRLALDRSRIGGVTIDGASGMVRAERGVVHVDSGLVTWPDGWLRAEGALGLAAPDSGTIRITASAASLTPFDSLVRAASGVTADTLHPHVLTGRADAAATVHGSLDAMTVAGAGTAAQVVLDSWHLDSLDARFLADSFGKRRDSLVATAIAFGMGDHVADTIRVSVGGRSDSITVNAQVRMLNLAASGSGSWIPGDSVSRLRLDALGFRFPHEDWSLTAPTRIRIGRDLVTFTDTLGLATPGGASVIRIGGVLPGDVAGDLTLHASGVDLVDIFGVLQRDTTVLGGLGAADVRVGGTRAAPTIHGQVTLTNLIGGDVRPPDLHASFDYESQKLNTEFTFVRTGKPLFDVKVQVPYDLALAGRDDRRLPGPISIVGTGDSVDLGILEAVIPGLRNTTGRMQMDLHGSGTWAAPTLVGSFSIRDGEMTIPALNVRYSGINGRAQFVADSMIVDSITVQSGDGSLRAEGSVRFAQLNRPTLNLNLRSRQFLAMDVPNYLRLRSSGNMKLTGPLTNPVLSGSATVSQSVLYFADLVTKSVINLEDPANIGLVDTTVLRRQGLRSSFDNRFMDSLRIDNLTFQLGSDVWLRSDEANIQLEGQVTVNKLRKQYELSGSFNAQRGTYTLRVGPLNRDFTVERGSVQYFNTPDLNADLDLQARHVVRTVDGDEVPILAQITGTILVPHVTLSSPGKDLPQRDLVSYLMFGRSEFQLAASGQQGQQAQQVVQGVATVFSAAAFGEAQRTLMTDLGLSSLEIRPGTGTAAGAGVTQLAAGLQLGRKVFVTFDAGFCLGSQVSNLQKRNFGASIEYRISREWRLQAAAEPVQSCITNRASDIFTTLNRYQLGGDLFWQKEY